METHRDPWYIEAFGEHYLEVYSHRDLPSARREVDFLVRALELAPGASVLDLACGAGRHSRTLAESGLRVLGVDRSRPLLRKAREQENHRPELRYLQADMRQLPLAGPFDAVLLLFTSFGYFPEQAEDAAVLAEVFRVLRPDGAVLLDLMNRDRILSRLEPRTRRRLGDADLEEKRWISPDGGRVEKQVRLERPGHPLVEYIESVRLYRPEEVTALLEAAGFRVDRLWGDFQGSPLESDSQRMIVMARK